MKSTEEYNDELKRTRTIVMFKTNDLIESTAQSTNSEILNGSKDSESTQEATSEPLSTKVKPIKWLINVVKWNSYTRMILKENFPGHISLKQTFELKDLLANSEAFPIKFPTMNPRCKMLLNYIDSKTLKRNMDSAYPIVHEKALQLFVDFLLYIKENGSNIEKRFYKKMTILEFINRLLKKKAASFIDPGYRFLLADGNSVVGGMTNKAGVSGQGAWNFIGTSKEEPPLNIQNCLSNDEIKLTSFISLSCYSYFINKGSYENMGNILEDRSQIQHEGVVISLVPPKITIPHLYEFQDIIIQKNDKLPLGYRLKDFFMNFYEVPIETRNKSNEENWSLIGKDAWFNDDIYSKRLALVLDPFFVEANKRAEHARKKAYVYLMGIGLINNWSVSAHQETIFVDTVATRLGVLGKYLTNISDIHFVKFPQTKKNGIIKTGEILQIPGHPTGIQIHIYDREPFEKLKDPDKLLVVSYAAEANALPGNEFWKGILQNSSNSAMASSSQVAELQNPHINTNIRAENMRIVLANGQMKLITKYCEQI